MSIKGACPSCGTGGDISFFIADADARKATLAAAKLPSDCGVAVIKYISLFSPGNRFLTPGRYSKLISECCDMIISGVAFDRDHVKAPSYVWRQAMIDMVDNQSIQRPIKNHHYLLRIVQSILTRRNDVDQSDRAASRRNAEPSRIRSDGMQSMGDIIKKSSLPDIPADVRDEWLSRARTDLESQGMHKNFIIAPLILQRAKELYADECK